MTEVEFMPDGFVPKNKDKRRKTESLIAQLAQKPGVWALVRTEPYKNDRKLYARVTAYSWRLRQRPELESVVLTGDGVIQVYARHVPVSE